MSAYWSPAQLESFGYVKVNGRWYDPVDEATELAQARSQPALRIGSAQGAAPWPAQGTAKPPPAKAPLSPAKTVATILPALDQRAAARNEAVAFKGATVVGDVIDPAQTQARIDGDATAVGVPSLIGKLRTGDRVIVAFVPPQGAYIIGWAQMPARRLPTAAQMATTWTVAGAPLTIPCVWHYVDEDRVVADYRLTIPAGALAGGVLVVDLPVPCLYGDHPVGRVRLGGFTFNVIGFNVINAEARTGGAQVSWFVEDTAGNLLSSVGHGAGAGDTLSASLAWRAP